MAGRWDWLCLYVVVVLCTLVTCSAQEVVEGFEGGAVVLPCTVSIQEGLLIRTGGQVLKENTAWRDVISLVGSSNNLSISSLSRQRDDGTMFRCEGTRPGGGDQVTNVRVLVRIAGVRIVQASEGQVTLTEGTPKQLTCSATGSPNPNASYSWTVDDGSVTQQGSSYSLTANRSMRSVSCTATNNYSNGSVLSRKTATATLNVLYLDTPRATTPVNVTEDETATLQCSAQGNPQPRFEWRRSGSAEVKSTSADYRLENVPRSAAGEYTCSATNSAGSRRTTVQLLVQYPPEVTVTYDNSSRTLTCTAKQGIPDSYTFSRWEHRVGETVVRELRTGTSGTSVTYTLPDTPTYADTGDYVCTVTNGIRSPQTGSFYVAPPTQAVFQNRSQTVVIGLRRTETISVSFYVRPSSGGVQVRWERSGQSDALGSHREDPGPVRLVVYGQEVRLQGTVTTLTLTDVRPTDEGEYSVTVTCDVNGKVETSQTRLYVNVTEISGGKVTTGKGGSNIGPIVGGILGGLVCILLICAGVVVGLRRHKTTDSPEVADGRQTASVGENNERVRGFPTDTGHRRESSTSPALNYELLQQSRPSASLDQTYDQLQVPVVGRHNTYENTEVPGANTGSIGDTSRNNYETLLQVQFRSEEPRDQAYARLEMPDRGRHDQYENTEVPCTTTRSTNERDNCEALHQSQSRDEGSHDQGYDQLEMPVRGRNDMYENTQLTVQGTRTTDGASYENMA